MTPMKIAEVVRDIHALDADLENYERKYGVLSETFYEAYRAGEEPADDAWVLDWSDWAGAYEIWLQRRQQYQDLMRNLVAQTTLSEVLKRAACREPLELAHLNTRRCFYGRKCAGTLSANGAPAVYGGAVGAGRIDSQ